MRPKRVWGYERCLDSLHSQEIRESSQRRPCSVARTRAPRCQPSCAAGVKGQLSHGLAGRCGTMASMPDTDQDADLRIRIPVHWPHGRH